MKKRIVNFIKLFFHKSPQSFSAQIHQPFKYTKILQHPINLSIEAYSKQQAINIAREMINSFNNSYGSSFVLVNVTGVSLELNDSIFNLDKESLIERQKYSIFYELENHADYWFMNDNPSKKELLCEKLN